LGSNPSDMVGKPTAGVKRHPVPNIVS
jgi:hypothetical protein